ncbi:hypothetical protein [Lacibacter sp. H407]|uniref:hypothetical protein n=1 Tax=Lacibacter sp. H407 TaxID=3133423 RepID=UPI0030BE9C45
MRTLYVLNIIGLILFFTVVESKRLTQQKEKRATVVKKEMAVRTNPLAVQEFVRPFAYPLPTGIILKFALTTYINH